MRTHRGCALCCFLTELDVLAKEAESSAQAAAARRREADAAADEFSKLAARQKQLHDEAAAYDVAARRAHEALRQMEAEAETEAAGQRSVGEDPFKRAEEGAVSLSFLQGFAAQHVTGGGGEGGGVGPSTKDVVERVIKPATKEKQCRFIDLGGAAVKPADVWDGRRDAERPFFFISHAFRCVRTRMLHVVRSFVCSGVWPGGFIMRPRRRSDERCCCWR